MLPVAGGGGESAAEALVDFGCRIGDHHHQHLLVHVHCCYVVGHCFLSGEEAADRANCGLRTPSCLCSSSIGRATSHSSVQHARSGSNSLTASTYPERVRPLPLLALSSVDFHHSRWAPGPWALPVVTARP